MSAAGGDDGFDGIAGGGAAVIGDAVHVEGVAVQVDGAGFTGQAGDVRIGSEDPLGIRIQFHIDFAFLSIRVDAAGKGGAIRQIEVQVGNLIHQHVAIDLLGRCVQCDLAAVGTFRAPACRRGPQEDAVRIVIDDGGLAQVDLGDGVVNEEYVAVLVGQGPAVHGEGGEAFFRVAGHGLVDHDGLIVFGLVAVFGVIVRGEIHVVQGHGILPFHHHALGSSGFQGGIADSDVGGGVDHRGSGAVGGIGAAGNVHGPAAPVRPDRCGGIAGGVDVQVFRIHRPAAGGHQSAGAVAGGLDHGIFDGNGGPFSVAEYGVGVFTGCVDHHFGEFQRAAVGGEDGGVIAVKIRFIAGVGITGLVDGGVGISQGFAVSSDDVFAISGGLQGLCDLDGVCCQRRSSFRRCILCLCAAGGQHQAKYDA